MSFESQSTKFALIVAVLAALRPATAEEIENYNLVSEKALIGEYDGKLWFFDLYDSSGTEVYPMIFSSDESHFFSVDVLDEEE